jgi:hypothetical protein
MLFPEIDLTVPTAFEVAAAWGDGDDAAAEVARAPVLAPKTIADAHTIGKHISLIHLLLCRFISSTKTRGEFLRGIRLHLDVFQASECYTYKDNSTLNEYDGALNAPYSSVRCDDD